MITNETKILVILRMLRNLIKQFFEKNLSVF